MTYRRHLVRWESEYAADDLRVVEVSGGDSDYLPSLERFRKWDLSHPVLWDRGGLNARNYGVTNRPYALLLGRDGKVIWHGNPITITRDKQTESAFRQLLEQHLCLSK